MASRIVSGQLPTSTDYKGVSSQVLAKMLFETIAIARCKSGKRQRRMLPMLTGFTKLHDGVRKASNET